MSDLGLQLPLRIVALAESVKVIEVDGLCAAYLCTCAERGRRLQTKRLSPEEGVATAKIIVHALTVELERRNSGLGRDTIDLLRATDAATERA